MRCVPLLFGDFNSRAICQTFREGNRVSHSLLYKRSLSSQIVPKRSDADLLSAHWTAAALVLPFQPPESPFPSTALQIHIYI